MNKNLFRSVAAAVVLLGCGMSSVSAKADAWTTVNGAPVRIATTLTVFEAGDDRLLERLRHNLMDGMKTTDPLPYGTIPSIPDARLVGYGDCKTISVAMRNILIEQGFAEDSLLLATAVTEKGDPHMVLLIRGKWRGREEVRVFDIRVREITTVERLIEHGYKFDGIQSASGPDAILVGWNGRDYY